MDAPALPDGEYPFVSERYKLADMAFIEAPYDLDTLFKAQAVKNGAEIIRDEPVELRCQSEAWPDATFLIYWPRRSGRIHVLVPKKFVTGRA